MGEDSILACSEVEIKYFFLGMCCGSIGTSRGFAFSVVRQHSPVVHKAGPS